MGTSPTITTTRLVLRALREADVDPLTELLQDRRISMNTATIPWPYAREDGVTFIGRERGPGDHVWALVRADDDAFMGTIGLHEADPRHRRAELGYWIGAPYWGDGYATEAAQAVVDWGFANLDLNRIFACWFPRNPASGRILEKIGMIDEGMSREHFEKDGELLDMRHAAILRREHETR